MRSFNRPRRLAIVAAHGAWRVELPDAANEPPGAAYAIDLPEPVAGCVTVVLEATYGPAQGATAIAELEVFADGERGGGGDALLAHIVAEGAAGAVTAAATLARRGAAGAAAIDGELAATTDPATRRRLIHALAGIADPAAVPALGRAAAAGWVRDQDLLDVIAALGALGQAQELHDLAARGSLPVAARAAAIAQLPVTGPGLALLVDLAGAGGRELRRAVIDRLSGAPAAALLAAVANEGRPAAAGDLWRAMTRGARLTPAARGPVLAAMLAALPAAADYERRYRLIDGIAALGDADAMATLDSVFREPPASAERSALRQVALRAIGSAPRPEALRFVLDSVRDRDPGVRLAALAALAGGDGDAAGPPAGAPAGAWSAAGKADPRSGAIGDAIDSAIADASADDDWPEVRRRAVTALGSRCPRKVPVQALDDALDEDPDLGVRGDALSALVQCRAPAPPRGWRGCGTTPGRRSRCARARCWRRSRSAIRSSPPRWSSGSRGGAARRCRAPPRWSSPRARRRRSAGSGRRARRRRWSTRSTTARSPRSSRPRRWASARSARPARPPPGPGWASSPGRTRRRPPPRSAPPPSAAGDRGHRVRTSAPRSHDSRRARRANRPAQRVPGPQRVERLAQRRQLSARRIPSAAAMPRTVRAPSHSASRRGAWLRPRRRSW